MRPIKRIAVGMEFTDAAQSALLEANVLARTLGAEVVLVHALHEPETGVIRDHAAKLLGRIKTDLEADRIGVYTPFMLRAGTPADVLLTAARDTRSDLIVLGAGEKTATDRLLLGSTAERVARESLLPVWLTRPGQEHRKLTHILCAVDGTDLANEALGAAASLARTFSARLDLLTVGSWNAVPGSNNRYTLDLTAASAVPGAATTASGALERALSGVDLHGVEHRVLVREGMPAARIIECAAEVAADLLVIGSAGRRGLARLTRGNTAEKVIRQVPCSTLVVPRTSAA